MIQFPNKDYHTAKEEVLLQVLTKKPSTNLKSMKEFFTEHKNAYTNYLSCLYGIKSKKGSDAFYFEKNISFFYEGNNTYIAQSLSLDYVDGCFKLDIESVENGLELIALIARKNGYKVAMKTLKNDLPTEQWSLFLSKCENIFSRGTLVIYE